MQGWHFNFVTMFSSIIYSRMCVKLWCLSWTTPSLMILASLFIKRLIAITHSSYQYFSLKKSYFWLKKSKDPWSYFNTNMCVTEIRQWLKIWRKLFHLNIDITPYIHQTLLPHCKTQANTTRFYSLIYHYRHVIKLL